MPANSRRKLRCAYMEGGRRCPRPGTGNPPLCSTCRLAVADASKPKNPLEVIFGALDSLLAGKPINTEAALGAASSLFEQWKMGGGLAAGYQPPSRDGSARWDPRWVPGSGTGSAGDPRQRPPAPPPPDDRINLERQARRVLGFAATEPLTEDAVKDRRRRLAKRFHPDVAGGSAAKMAEINDAADVLIAASQA